MNILKLFNEVIQWCDGNVGFLNVILSICTLTLTITIAKIPYKKKIVGTLEIMQEKTKHDPFFKCYINVYLTNVGGTPIYIKNIEIVKRRRKSIGSFLMNLGHGQCRELNMGEKCSYSGMFIDPILDKHSTNLNGHVRIRVTDIAGKRYYISRTFPVG